MGFSQVPSRPNVCSVVCCLLFVVCCVTKPRFGPDCLTSHGDVCPLWGLPSYMQGLRLRQSTPKFGLWASKELRSQSGNAPHRDRDMDARNPDRNSQNISDTPKFIFSGFVFVDEVREAGKLSTREIKIPLEPDLGPRVFPTEKGIGSRCTIHYMSISIPLGPFLPHI